MASPARTDGSFADRVGALFAGFVARVCGANATAMAATATAVVATGQGGLVRPAGAGHSAMPVMDSFYRAGGLAFVRPIWDHRTVVFEGAGRPPPPNGRSASAGRSPRPRRSSRSTPWWCTRPPGVSPYPVEIAEVARESRCHRGRRDLAGGRRGGDAAGPAPARRSGRHRARHPRPAGRCVLAGRRPGGDAAVQHRERRALGRGAVRRLRP